MYHIVNVKQLYIIQEKVNKQAWVAFMSRAFWVEKCGWGWDFAWVWFEAEVEYGWV